MVNKEEFDKRLKASYDNVRARKPWDQAKVRDVLKILQDYKRKTETDEHYKPTSWELYYNKHYGILQIGNVYSIFQKKNPQKIIT